jgi:hypothetical protein
MINELLSFHSFISVNVKLLTDKLQHHGENEAEGIGIEPTSCGWI